jgi:hypothetical protein
VLLSPLSDPLAASIPRRQSARDCWLTVAPPGSLGCPPPADPLPRMPKGNALRTCSVQVCCAGARREQEAGACERASAAVPRHCASVYVLRACIHPSSSTQMSALDGSQCTLARVDGWTDASSGTATGRTSRPRDWTGYDPEAEWPLIAMDHGLRHHRRAEGSGDRRWGGEMPMMCRWDIGEREGGTRTRT